MRSRPRRLALAIITACLFGPQAWAVDPPPPIPRPVSSPAGAGKTATPDEPVRIKKPRHRRASAARRGKPISRPLDALGQANTAARDGPASGVFVNSALYHAFEPGRLYTLHTRPGFLTTIALRPGETLISKAAGDTVRWVLGETEAGVGASRQVIILVKPMRPGLRTNIILTTDQRTYLIDAISTASSAYTSVLSWTYPKEEALARTATAASAALAPASLAVPVDRLDFRYAITVRRGRPPPWTPLRVFDDGAKTYIEFPPDLAVREAPPLFLLGADDAVELVNTRLVGRYMVVDRLIERAELRLGDKKPVVVRIAKAGARS